MSPGRTFHWYPPGGNTPPKTTQKPAANFLHEPKLLKEVTSSKKNPRNGARKNTDTKTVQIIEKREQNDKLGPNVKTVAIFLGVGAGKDAKSTKTHTSQGLPGQGHCAGGGCPVDLGGTGQYPCRTGGLGAGLESEGEGRK